VTSERTVNSDVSPTWTEVARPGREPLLRQVAPRLWKVQLQVVFILPGGMTSVEDGLITLHRFANHTSPVLVSYSLLESGFYRITDMPITSTRKHPVTNQTVRAEVVLSLTNEPNPPATIPGRPPAAVPSTRPSTHTSTKPAGKAPAATRYTVRSGDNLSKIAAHFYGSASLFPLIATANKLKNPNLIKPGQVLIIPPRK
jgi:LysM repeat protein